MSLFKTLSPSSEGRRVYHRSCPVARGTACSSLALWSSVITSNALGVLSDGHFATVAGKDSVDL